SEVHGEAACRKQHVVKKSGAGTGTANHEDGSSTSGSYGFCGQGRFCLESIDFIWESFADGCSPPQPVHRGGTARKPPVPKEAASYCCTSGCRFRGFARCRPH